MIASIAGLERGRAPVGFTGSFGGNGHSLRNMVVRGASLSYTGFFGLVGRGGTVTDLKIEAADIQAGRDCVGILAGCNNGRVINCQAGGRVSGPPMSLGAGDTGGLVGWNKGDIVYCRADTNLVWGFQYVGGLVGTNDLEGRIVGSRAECRDVYAWKTSAGGLVGANAGYIVGSYATVQFSDGISRIAMAGWSAVTVAPSSIVMPITLFQPVCKAEGSEGWWEPRGAASSIVSQAAASARWRDATASVV